MTPTVVSLFAGCGGSSLGYKLAGCDVRLAVEWDETAATSYRANFPDACVYNGDVAKLDGEEALRLAGVESGELTILDASPPCQGFSTSGKRHLHDPRNRLFVEFVRLLRAFRPRALVMENVRGMTVGRMRAVLAECLEELRASGYRVKAGLVDAQFYGVPQQRTRLIVTGVREDVPGEPVLPRPRSAPIQVGVALQGVENRTFQPGGLSERDEQLWRTLRPGQCGKDLGWAKGRHFDTHKLDPRRPSPVVLASRQGLLHWDKPRTLTIEELRRVGGFPDDFQLSGVFSAQWRQIGNCVPPPLIRSVAEDLLGAIDGT